MAKSKSPLGKFLLLSMLEFKVNQWNWSAINIEQTKAMFRVAVNMYSSALEAQGNVVANLSPIVHIDKASLNGMFTDTAGLKNNWGGGGICKERLFLGTVIFAKAPSLTSSDLRPTCILWAWSLLLWSQCPIWHSDEHPNKPKDC